MEDNRTFVIAEAGVNHNGSLDQALQLVDVAAGVGADAVKFQIFRAGQLVSKAAAMANYQERNLGKSGTQFEMLRRLELSLADYKAIASHCRARDIAFMATAFDLQSLRALSDFDIPAVKIASGDATAAPLLLEAAKLGRPIVFSTGMCTIADIEAALGVISFGLLGERASPSRAAFEAAYLSPQGRKALSDNVTLLHCVTEYPAPPGEINLLAMDVLRTAFGLRVGYSDHTLGIAVALAAVARGAAVIEKHFTLDRTLAGPDHQASLEPAELEALVRGVREIELALGEARKSPSEAELRNRRAARRSLVASQAIRAGEAFDASNLSMKRPGDGVSPLMYWDYLGRKALRDYSDDELIDP